MNRLLLSLFIILASGATRLQADHLSSHLLFTAQLRGDQEVPAVTTNARGVASFSLDEKKTTLYLHVSLSNLSGPVTGIHIHDAPSGQNGGVVFDLGGFLSGNRAKGVLRNLTPAIVEKFLTGGYYINVHTADNPAGEIRGQIRLETDQCFTAEMDGTHEVPEVVTDGKGLGIFKYNREQSLLSFSILFRNLSSALTGVHIHNAAAGTNGPVLFDLTPFVVGNRIDGEWEPGSDFRNALLNGQLYVNIHTENHPGGEIRGQIFLSAGIPFDARFSGDQENPSVATPGSGLGIITVSYDLSEVQHYILFDSLSGPVVGAHYHIGNPGMNGGVVLDMTGDTNNSDNTVSGTRPLSSHVFNLLLTGGLYINLHTDLHPGGEIRGQVYRYAREGYVVEFNGGQEVPPVTTTGTGSGFVSIDRDQSDAYYSFVYSGLEGNYAAAHFHQGGPGVNGGVIFDITTSFDVFGAAQGYWNSDSNPAFAASPLFRSNSVYTNVHTDLHPGGEIRGNILRIRDLFSDLPFDPGFSDDLILTAILTGENEVPAVTTDAVALATVFFDSDKNTAKVNITATGLSGPITGAHIHEGDPGTNGPVLFPLVHEGNRIQMEIPNLSTIDLISLMNGGTYVNIHTAANPGGEIRGQLTLDQDPAFRATLTGSEEVPAVVTDALGLAVLHWTVGTLNLEINAQFTTLSSPIVGVHLHAGGPGENGPVIADLGHLLTGNQIRGLLDVNVETLINLLFENVYINVHTENNPGGEIRGQLFFLPGITFDGWLSGDQENPFATTAGSGLAVGTIFPALSDIALWMVSDQVSGEITAAHLHQGALGVNGGVVHDLTNGLNDNSILHLGLINDGVLSSLLTGNIYINAHTAAFPGGEIRGQLFRRARDGYGFDLCPEQEVGSTINAPGATGSGLVSIDRHHSKVNMIVVTDGLTGDISASHIHQAGIGQNGGVITDLTDFYEDGVMILYGAGTDTALVNRIRSGNTYVNVHTALHPGGEIRGQIVKDFLCSIETSIDPIADIISDIQLSPVPVIDRLQVRIESQQSADLTMSIADISGQVIASARHTVTTGENMVTMATETLLPGFYVLMISDGRAAKAYKFVK